MSIVPDPLDATTGGVECRKSCPQLDSAIGCAFAGLHGYHPGYIMRMMGQLDEGMHDAYRHALAWNCMQYTFAALPQASAHMCTAHSCMMLKETKTPQGIRPNFFYSSETVIQPTLAQSKGRHRTSYGLRATFQAPLSHRRQSNCQCQCPYSDSNNIRMTKICLANEMRGAHSSRTAGGSSEATWPTANLINRV